MKKLLSIIFLLIIVFTKSSFAQKTEAGFINITSDYFELQSKLDLMTFSKNVLIEGKNISAKCQKAVVTLDAKNKKVKRITLTGNVIVKKDSSEIHGDRAIIEPDNENVIVEGNVKTKVLFNN